MYSRMDQKNLWKTALKKLKFMMGLNRPYHLKFFNGCLPQILLRYTDASILEQIVPHHRSIIRYLIISQNLVFQILIFEILDLIPLEAYRLLKRRASGVLVVIFEQISHTYLWCWCSVLKILKKFYSDDIVSFY